VVDVESQWPYQQLEDRKACGKAGTPTARSVKPKQSTVPYGEDPPEQSHPIFDPDDLATSLYELFSSNVQSAITVAIKIVTISTTRDDHG